MSWTCPKCNNEVSDDASLVCNVCGYIDILVLRFQSEAGNEWQTKTDVDVNRRAYRRLYPGVEHQYVSHEEGCHPFSLKRKRRGWELIANPDSTLAVKLNDDVCMEGVAYELHSGDKIWLASKEDTSVQVAPLTVSLDEL